MTDTEYQQTTLKIEKNLHRRTKMWCAKNGTDVTKLINTLVAEFMKGKRVR